MNKNELNKLIQEINKEAKNIVEDKTNVRTTNDISYGNYNFTTDGQGRVASVANDPNIPTSYPNGDEFYFPALGNAVFFQFEEDSKTLSFWEYGFEDYLKYDSIYLIKSEKYQLIS